MVTLESKLMHQHSKTNAHEHPIIYLFTKQEENSNETRRQATTTNAKKATKATTTSQVFRNPESSNGIALR